VQGSGRSRTCERCGATNPAESARWCGGCGAVLAVPDQHDPSPGLEDLEPPDDVARAASPRRAGPITVGVVPIAALVVGLGWFLLIGREPTEHPRPSRDQGVEVPAPDDPIAAPGPVDDDVAAEEPSAEAPDPPATDDGSSSDPQVMCVSAPDCVVWTTRVTTQPLPPTMGAQVADDLLVVTERSASTSPDEIVADVVTIDVGTGAEVWRTTVASPARDAPEPPPMRPRVAIVDRWAVVADCKQLTALSLADGQVDWSLPMPCPFTLHEVATAPREEPEILLVSTSQPTPFGTHGTVTAVAMGSGNIRWTRDATAATVTPDGVVVTTEDGQLVSLDAVTGVLRWEVSSTVPSPQVRSVAGAVLVSDGSDDDLSGHLLSAADGRPLLEGTVQRHGSPTIGNAPFDGGAELVVSAMQVLLIEEGEIRWAVPQLAAACCAGDHVTETHVVAKLDDGRLVVRDRTDGSGVAEHAAIRFQFDSETFLAGRFVVAAYEAIGGDSASLRVFDAEERHLVAKMPGARVLASLPDGDVLFATGGHVFRLTSP
jgi:outer membrane protein assembly factor BamB